MMTIVVLSLAAAILVCAVWLPEHKRDPNRFFGVPGREIVDDTRTQQAQRIFRMLTAARVFVSRSAGEDSDDDGDAAEELLPQSTSLDVHDDRHAINTVSTQEPYAAVETIETPEPAAEFDGSASSVSGHTESVDARVVDPPEVVEPNLPSSENEASVTNAPDVSMHTDDHGTGDDKPVVRFDERSDARDLDDTSVLEVTSVDVAGSVDVASDAVSDVVAIGSEIRKAPEIGNDGRAIIWPRLLGLPTTSLTVPERLGIVATMGAIGEEYVMPILCEVLEQEAEPTIRDAAIEAIRDAKLAGALHVLETSMSSVRDRERLLVVEALAAVDADELLERALEDPCVAVITAAAVALRRRQAISDVELNERLASRGDDGARVHELIDAVL